VVDTVEEHSSGSFIIILAPLRALLESQPRRKDPRPRRQSRRESSWSKDFRPATISALRALAAHSLDTLGAPQTEMLIQDEMRRQYDRLIFAIGKGTDRDARLRAAINKAFDEMADE
jgi:hypothetical protein